VAPQQLSACRPRLESFLTEMLPPLRRKDRRHWAGVYLRGLLLDGDRKSAGGVAARLPDGNEQNLQQFLNQSPWAWLPLWQTLAQRAERAFASPQARIIDDKGSSFRMPAISLTSDSKNEETSASSGIVGSHTMRRLWVVMIWADHAFALVFPSKLRF
jgi:hypothetical protein